MKTYGTSTEKEEVELIKKRFEGWELVDPKGLPWSSRGCMVTLPRE
jgi:hypothetical protein